MTRNELTAFINSVVTIRTSVNDKQASMAVSIYPTLHGNGELIKTGTRIAWNNQLKRAAVDLWDTSENTPEKAPELWENIDYIDGVRKIPEIITVGISFSKGEHGWWEGSIYESVIDDNVYNPRDYPTGWKQIA